MSSLGVSVLNSDQPETNSSSHPTTKKPGTHGGKRAGAGRKKGILGLMVMKTSVSRSGIYRALRFTDNITPEANDWLRQNWPKATQHALQLTVACRSPEIQIAALQWLQGMHKVRRKVDLGDLARHLLGIGLINERGEELAVEIISD
jgi:hypothetical protein